jgi:hypothetical protein
MLRLGPEEELLHPQIRRKSGQGWPNAGAALGARVPLLHAAGPPRPLCIAETGYLSFAGMNANGLAGSNLPAAFPE